MIHINKKPENCCTTSHPPAPDLRAEAQNKRLLVTKLTRVMTRTAREEG